MVGRFLQFAVASCAVCALAAEGVACKKQTTGFGIGDLRAKICTQSQYPSPLSGVQTPTAKVLGSAKYSFVEGPVWVDAHQKLYFTEMIFSQQGPQGPPSKINTLTPEGKAGVFVASTGCNGIALGPDNSLLAACHDKQLLARFALSNGQRTDVPVTTNGKHFNSPNDLVMRSDGTVYFTDPDWQLPPRKSETNVTAAYRITPTWLSGGAVNAVPFESTVDKPNGIALSPDERTLYLGGNVPNVYAYDVAADGSLSNRRAFAQTGSSDGFTVDCAGNLYVAGGGGTIKIYAPNGSSLGTISVPETTSNVAFGGKDHKTLFITATTSVYSIKLAVPGLPY